MSNVIRYSVSSKGMSLGQLKMLCVSSGAKKVDIVGGVNQVTCDMDEAVLARVSQYQDVVVRKLVGVTKGSRVYRAL